jgi:hypothetical protein
MWQVLDNTFGAEEWRQNIRTISDFIMYMQATAFSYVTFEPVMDWFGDSWDWVTGGDTIHDYGQGVCADITQLAVYMLAGDFEDWGVVYIGGQDGHIFNWFCEDGCYYVADFTNIASAHSNGDYSTKIQRGSLKVDPQQWQGMIDKYSSFEGMKAGLTAKHDDILVDNYALYLHSCLGHNYYPVVFNKGFSMSRKEMRQVINGEKELTVFFDECAFEGADIIWASSDKFHLGSIPAEQIPISLRTAPTCCYGDKLIRIR